eukprot:TRINITY_DN1815_c0_g2_i2.p1 TRINITY_DN1815_c0_g2~~TRINITY_DN1815_c0_g2_i2.p1  ORF type:complete len:3411 (+),score=645.92 TRINITY_DN1815_c0_g2_i2:668-10234(+)
MAVVVNESVFPPVGVPVPSFALVPPAEGPGTEPPYVAGETSRFKLVPAAKTCFDTPSALTHNLEPCDPASGACPRVVLPSVEGDPIGLLFTVPLTPGEYRVCFRFNDTTPWQVFPNVDTGSEIFYASATGLSAAADPDRSNATVVDLGVGADGEALATWCADGEGTDCADGPFVSDLFTLANGTNLCPVPTAHPSGDGPDANNVTWWPLTAISNSTVAVQPLADYAVPLTLPPAHPSPSGLYRLCVFKAADPEWIGGRYVRGGVVYHVENTGSPASGGGGIYWRDPSGDQTPAYLTAAVDVEFDNTLRFMQYTDTTEEVYSSQEVQARLEATEISDTRFSRTPLIRSGTMVSFELRIFQQAGLQVPYGDYAVEARRCVSPKGTNWDELACEDQIENDVYGVTEVVSFDGECDTAKSEEFGWPRGGRRQFFREGIATFRFRYASHCSGFFGCGLQFAMQVNETLEVVSPPVWINTYQNYPNDVEVADASETSVPLSGGGEVPDVQDPPTFLASCFHLAECPVTLRAWYDNLREYSAAGEVAVAYSTLDYRADSAARTLQLKASFRPETVALPSLLWNATGEIGFTLIPALEGTVHEADLFVNVTWESGKGVLSWRRLVIHVVRELPIAFRPVDVRPIDVDYPSVLLQGRLPTPPFITAVDEGKGKLDGQGIYTHLRAVPGSYIETLVPYRLTFEAVRDTGAVMPTRQGLTGWLIKGGLFDSLNRNITLMGVRDGGIRDAVAKTNNMLGVLWAIKPEESIHYAQPSPGNFETHPGSLTTPVYPFPIEQPGGDWSLYFRVRNTLGCSRFNLEGGCRLKFVFSNGKAPESLEIQLLTAVRVVASMVRLTTAVPSATVREGILVTAEPGTSCGVGCWYPDEFHYGDIFALIHGPGGHDGVSTQDGTTMLQDTARPSGCLLSTPQGGCQLWKYPTGAVLSPSGESVWAAQWMLRTTRPCYECEFTVHSTLGGGPDSFTDPDSTLGLETLSFHDEPMRLVCNVEGAIVPSDPTDPPYLKMYVDWTDTLSFAVTATAVSDHFSREDRAGVHPTWPVWLDTAAMTHLQPMGVQAPLPVALKHRGNATTALLKSQLAAGTGATVFDGLYLELTDDATTPLAPGGVEDLLIYLNATGPVYGNATAGTTVVGEQEYQCTVRVQVHYTEPQTEMTVGVTIDGAVPMCDDGQDACDVWGTSIEALEEGLTLNTVFTEHRDGISVPLMQNRHNATIRPLGGSKSVPFGSAPFWTTEWEAEKLSAEVVLDSQFNVGPEWIDAELIQYHHGRVTARVERPFARNGTLTMRFANAERAPLRGGVFEVCDSAWDVTQQQEYAQSTCTQITLHVLPKHTPQFNYFLRSEPTPSVWNGLVHRGSGAMCGAAPQLLELEVVSWFVVNASDPFTRFYGFGVPAEYTVTLPGQQFIRPGGMVVLPNVTMSNGIPPAARGSYAAVASSQAHAVTASFYAVHVLGSADAKVPFTVNVVGHYAEGGTFAFLEDGDGIINTDDTAVTNATLATRTEYFFGNPEDSYATFEMINVGDGALVSDPECPGRRYIESSAANYRTYVPVQGSKWDYAFEAAVGLPIPMEVMVKTSQGARAWGFDPLAVHVQKVSKRGCNDGGSMTIHTLRPSEVDVPKTLFRGRLEESWRNTGLPGVHMEAGMALFWTVFSEPCEECVLRISLCKSTTTDLEQNCLSGTGASQRDADENPRDALRSLLTKPFSIRKARPNVVTVIEQRLPLTYPEGSGGVPVPPSQAALFGAVSEAQVGATFSLQLQLAQLFGASFAFEVEGAPASLSIRSVWDGAPRSGAAQDARYGNGGYLHFSPSQLVALTGVERSDPRACNVPPQEFAAATPVLDGMNSPMNGWQTLGWYFPRPCSACRVWVSYTLASSSGGAVSSGFYIRNYVPTAGAELPFIGDYLKVRVTTCGVRWSLMRHAAPRAARRRRPFSVTALWVDPNGMASWERRAPPAPFTLRVSAHGNGAGGRVMQTSPEAAESPGHLPPSDGSAFLRLHGTRACYRCSVGIASSTHEYTLLTDATQLVVAPRTLSARRTLSKPYDTNLDGPLRQQPSPSEAALGANTFEVDVYAADELGDRAYTLGGPTITAFQPRYQVKPDSGFTMQVTQPVSRTHRAVLNSNATNVRTGAPLATIVEGGSVLNGMPVEFSRDDDGAVTGVEAGRVVVRFDGQPVVDHALEFQLFPTNPVLAPGESEIPELGRLPTRLLGTGAAPLLTLTPRPQYLLLDDPLRGACVQPVAQGDTCEIRIFQAAWIDHLTATDPSYYLSTFAPDEIPGTLPSRRTHIHVSHVCSSPDYCKLVHDEYIPFVNGMATARAVMNEIGVDECACDLFFSPPEYIAEELGGRATQQRRTVHFERGAVATWTYAPSPNFAPVYSAEHRAYHAYSVPLRAVTMTYRALDKRGVAVSIDVTQGTPGYVRLDPRAMSPEGCFVCLVTLTAQTVEMCGYVPNPADPGMIDVAGYFASEGTCRVPANAAGELPTEQEGATVLARDGLVVTVDEPREVVIVERPSPTTVVGVGGVLVAEVVSVSGVRAAGDFHTDVTLSDLDGLMPSWRAKAYAGRVEFRPDIVTEGTSTPRVDLARFAGVRFVLHGTGARVDGSIFNLPDVPPLPPVTFVEAPSVVLVYATLPHTPNVRHLISDVPPGSAVAAIAEARRNVNDAPRADGGVLQWGAGFPFTLHVEVVSHLGWVYPATGRVTVTPLAAPCTEDAAAVLESCTPGLPCRAVLSVADLPQCSSQGWALNGATSSDALHFSLTSGTVSMTALYNPYTARLAQFKVATDLAGPDARYAVPQVLASMELGRAAALVAAGYGDTCKFGDDGQWRCSVGLEQHPKNVSLDLYIDVVDADRQVVRGDSFSSLELTSRCETGSSVAGRMVEGSLDVLSKIHLRVEHGRAHVTNVYFNQPCERMVITLLCTSGGVDTMKLCDGKTVVSYPFSVIAATDDGELVTPEPLEPMSVALEMGTLASEGDLANWVEGFDGTLFESSVSTLLAEKVTVVDGIAVRRICAIPEDENIAEVHYNTSACLTWTAQAVPRRAAGVLQESATPAPPVAPPLKIVVVFDVSTTVAVEHNELFNTISATISTDLTSETSFLRGSGDMFDSAKAPTKVDVPTPVPPTPQPATGTPPDTAVPNMTDIPATATPATSAPGGRGVGLGNPGRRSVPNEWTVWVLLAAALCVSL